MVVPSAHPSSCLRIAGSAYGLPSSASDCGCGSFASPLGGVDLTKGTDYRSTNQTLCGSPDLLSVLWFFHTNQGGSNYAGLHQGSNPRFRWYGRNQVQQHRCTSRGLHLWACGG